jgi:hypothetical protein
MEILIRAAVAVALVKQELVLQLLAAMVALVLSSYLFQRLNTLAQPQVHQLSQQAAQTQF